MLELYTFTRWTRAFALISLDLGHLNQFPHGPGSVSPSQTPLTYGATLELSPEIQAARAAVPLP